MEQTVRQITPAPPPAGTAPPAAPAFREAPLSGWGRHPVARCRVYRPESTAGVARVLGTGADESYVARGLGRAYGDAAINAAGGVVSLLRLDRFLSFDPDTRLLRAEAGVSLGEIIETFLPRGFFLPVTPGTRHVTLGGAIASDVHGKNHHRDGSFARFLRGFTLLTGTGETLVCSPSVNADVFWATVGGMGMTGIVLDAEIQLAPVESAWVLEDRYRARDLTHSLELFARHDSEHQYSVAWIDCLARGASLGRAVLLFGDHAPRAALPRDTDPLRLPRKARVSVPFDLPSRTLNRYTVSVFNAAYHRLQRERRGHLVDLGSYFYPLDAVERWNRLYGRPGFAQYQVALPEESGERALTALLQRLAAAKAASFLAVLKKFGDANPGLLSFPFRGYTLAVDLPVRPELDALLRDLDRLTLDHGGRVYLAKDSASSREAIAAMYPRLEEFRRINARLDPRGRFSSSLARRVGLVSR